MDLNLIVLLMVLCFGADPPWPEAVLANKGKPSDSIKKSFPMEWDWAIQDGGGEFLTWFSGKSDDRVLKKMVLKAAWEVGVAPKSFTLSEYEKLCLKRRQMRLKPLLDRWRTIVFTKHYDLGGSHYAYTEGQSDAQHEMNFMPGSALCLLEMDGIIGKVKTLIDDPNGVIRDPDVSYDGKHILFAWKKSAKEDDYHLYETDASGDNINQITFGKGFADIEGAYLPNDHIVFNSTRCVQTVDCWWTEVSNLYTCDREGRYLRRLGFDQVHTTSPSVLPDGRVVYTRWEYNDRGQIYPQPLFQMNFDGTGQTEFYGNNSWFPTTILHARGIPGTGKLVAVLSGHHSLAKGKLAWIEPQKGRQEADGVQLIAPIRKTEPVKVDAYGQTGEQFQYPYPIDENNFLAAFGQPKGRRAFSLYLIHADGRRELLAWDPENSCNQPVPLAPRPRPHVGASVVDYSKETGTFYLQDIHQGPGLEGVPRGTVKNLRVVKISYRAAGIGRTSNKGPGGGSLASTPVGVGNTAWDVKTVLGTATVHKDGSAFFEVPARTPVYFQALDEKNRVIQSMRSWSTLQPGESFSCVGCHESKNTAPPVGKASLAMMAGPQKLKPFYGPERGFSFIKEVQPILDKHCIGCHNNQQGLAPDLEGVKPIIGLESRWRYQVTPPNKNWNHPDFDDALWPEGKAGFGLKGTRGGEIHTEWTTKKIWLRKRFFLKETPNNKTLFFRLSHDEDVKVHLNNCLALDLKGYSTVLKTVKALEDGALKTGENLITLTCKQTTGGQFIDMALYAIPKGKLNHQPFSLLGTQTPNTVSKRRWSDAYLALTHAFPVNGVHGQGGEYQGNPDHPVVNWISSMSEPTMLKPYHRGAVKSELLVMLEKGHQDVRLSQEEMDKIACWIDLGAPYCGDYMEAHCWTLDEIHKYAHFLNKRLNMEKMEQDNIQTFLDKEK